MILVDANLLIYAIDADSPHHQQARQWLETVLSGDEETGFAWIVILAFIRITTHSRIMRAPLDPARAIGFIDEWLEQPGARTVSPGEKHWPVLRNLLESSGTAANLTSDAHLAALALEHGCTIYSADHDFNRFPGLKHVNPVAP
ncbi:MAG: type II toxin-antitoxin system VapC family toxin [Gammaproteobacteria bacterium]